MKRPHLVRLLPLHGHALRSGDSGARRHLVAEHAALCRPAAATVGGFAWRAGRCLCLAAALFAAFAVMAQTPPPLERPVVLPEAQFQEQLRSLEHLGNASEQARHANRWVRERWLSSQQVKNLAKTIAQEDARLDFALAAYPRTVDPENFYEVYDTFTSLSKVFRLHDQIQRLRPVGGSPPPHVVTQPVSDEVMADILKTVRAGNFDNTKLTLAREMLSGKRRFLSRQITELLKVFDFENARLEIAKVAYDSVIDPENYLLVSSAFSYSSSKEALAKHIEARKAETRPRPGR